MNYVLKTERLLLRPLERQDVPEIFKIAYKNHELTKFMSWDPPEEIEATQEFFKNVQDGFPERGISWAILHEDKFCGLISLEGITVKQRVWEVNCAELGYWLIPDLHRHGFMTEAGGVVLQFGFEQLRLHKINTSHISDNIASQRVIEKLGFRFVGEKKEDLFRHGIWWDYKLYEMTKKMYDTSNGL